MKIKVGYTKNNFILGLGLYKQDNEIHISLLWFYIEIIL